MTEKQMHRVIELYQEELKSRSIFPTRQPDGTPLAHAAWMLEEMKIHLRDGKWEKANRWLGFVQGILWCRGVYTIPQMADHNRV